MNKQHLIKLEDDLAKRAFRIRRWLRHALRGETPPDEALSDDVLMEIEDLKTTVKHIKRAIRKSSKEGAQ